jgi:hypothetical protein
MPSTARLLADRTLSSSRPSAQHKTRDVTPWVLLRSAQQPALSSDSESREIARKWPPHLRPSAIPVDDDDKTMPSSETAPITNAPPAVLTIAGSDPSGGAGIQVRPYRARRCRSRTDAPRRRT